MTEAPNLAHLVDLVSRLHDNGDLATDTALALVLDLVERKAPTSNRFVAGADTERVQP